MSFNMAHTTSWRTENPVEIRDETKGKRCCSGVMLCIRQFFVILAKNFLLQVRRPIGTVVELLFPIAAVAILVAIRPRHISSSCFTTFDSDHLSIPYTGPYTVFYTPNTTEVNNFTHTYLAPKLAGSGGELVAAKSEAEYIKFFRSFSGRENACFANGSVLVFNDIEGDNVDYTIRLRHEVVDNTWHTSQTVPSDETVGARTSPNSYFSEGFMQLEKVVDEAIIEYKTGKNVSLSVTTRQFPYPKYKDDFYLTVLSIILPLVVTLSLIYTAGMFIKELVVEKESRIRETMKMMGLSNWILVVTWYLKQILFFLIPLIVMTILLKYGDIFPISDGFLIFLYLFMFFASGMAFCFLISVWFSSARIGLFAGLIVWFLSWVAQLVVVTLYSMIPFPAKLGVCLISNVCSGFGVRVLTVLEKRLQGLHFDNFATALSPDDEISMGWVMLMLCVDIILYMMLYWYIDAVKPGKYGVPKPFYFFLLPSYWCGERSKRTPEEEEHLNPHVDSSAHEEEPHDLPVGISVDNLTKIYGRFNIFNRKGKKVAVDSLSLNMYKGQITVLLGHNGAGKTTTMSILTGLFPPTSGAAYINGLSVVKNIDLIRRNLGICPQHNVLFDRLTVREHLYFFAMLKGCPTHDLSNHVNRMMEDLLLADKRKIQCHKLSGGMKRKLSVGIALVGGSEVVILDEPTSGMDPYARRATWDLLNKHKEGRTVLLTTHFMDEADVLGDRIAIMADGKLKCSGSSLFLKSRYGVGYHMTVVKEPSCNSEDVTALITQAVPGSQQVADVGAELSFILPSEGTGQFPKLFDTLDRNKEQLGISSYGISVTTMEEVFMKAGQSSEVTLQSETKKHLSKEPQDDILPPATGATGVDVSDSIQEVADDIKTEPHDDMLPATGVTGVNVVDSVKEVKDEIKMKRNTHLILWFQQFFAMTIKRFYYSYRFWISMIWQLVIPMMFIILGLVVSRVRPTNNSNDPSRVLSITNSAPSDDIVFFYASFDGIPLGINIGSDNSSALGISKFENFTDVVMNIRDDIKYSEFVVGNESRCCEYNNQLLDKFCATRQYDEVYQHCISDNSFPSFGFHDCDYCLQCGSGLPASCTQLRFDYYDTSYCPVLSKVSIVESNITSPSGPLDSWNDYVAERLLQQSVGVNLATFFRTYQAGFVFHKKDAVVSSCGCANISTSCNLLSGSLNLTVNNSVNNLYDYCDDKAEQYANKDEICTSLKWNYEYNSTDDYCASMYNQYTYFCINSTVGRVTPPINSIVEPEVTIWYNNQPYHMAPAALNAFYNFYIKEIDSSLSITVNNHPLPRDLKAEDSASLALPVGFLTAMFTLFGFSFLYASFVVFVVQERDSKAKHLQFVSGVTASSYWLSAFLCDFLTCLIPCITAVILFAAFNINGYNGEALGVIFLLLILSCWGSIPLTYILSFLFSNALLGFIIIWLFYFCVPLVFQIIVAIVGDSHHVVNKIFLIHPGYCVIYALSTMYNGRSSCDSDFEDCHSGNILSFNAPGLGHVMLYLGLEGIVFTVLILIIQKQFMIGYIQKLFNSRYRSTSNLSENEMNNDVLMETRRVLEKRSFSADDAVVISGLVKEYRTSLNILCSPCGCFRSGRKLAVDGINLIIPTGECFGLLGVNGAGKTTTFKMLTGDIYPSNGTAYVCGYDIRTSLHQAQRKIGYCPQFDALLERLTGRELLTMFARLRGVPEKNIKNAVKTEIDRLDLGVYADKLSGTYSGGNKRKLSTAIALVGNPLILFLDEPTTGMDPATRRLLWNALIGVIREGRSVILTSHSMEECEALCTRLAIMVNGQFKCLGSIQHLKSKFGSEYTLNMNVGVQVSSDVSQISSPIADPYNLNFVNGFVTSNFPGALLLEYHQGSLTYQIPKENTSLSYLFSTIEDNRAALRIIDYSVSQTTLDQVFINFAKRQDFNEEC